MIFAIGFVLALFGYCTGYLLAYSGSYDIGVYRRTDWLVVLPFFGGVCCMVWSLVAFVSGFLP